MTEPRPPFGKSHTIHREHHHLAWDNSQAPALVIAPGETVDFDEIDPMCGQLSPQSTAEVLSRIDLTKVNCIAGPIYVDGAQPGDTLKVTIVGFAPSGWAWTGIIPGFGLLEEDFPTAALHIWSYDKSLASPAAYGKWARIPMKPFCGTTGVAPADLGRFSTIPPYPHGGNMDIRDLSEGVDLYLPVKVAGALFSIGDTHCAQGDGEVCGTAIESPMGVSVRLDLIKGGSPSFPRFTTHGPINRHLDAKGYDATTGIGPDLMEAAKNAVRGMIELLGKSQGLNPEIAYMLCSVCGDLHISEIVDRPNWVVSCYMPRLIFE